MTATVLVAGALANKAGQGGEAWVRMSWAVGLVDLGFDVVFVEEIEEADETRIAYFRSVVEQFALTDQAALVVGDGREVVGMTRPELVAAADACALLVNISGHLRWPELRRRIACSAYVDIDPGFTQIWHAGGHDLGVDDHDLHFTIGANIGTPSCSIPTEGIHWRPVRQPVVLSHWPVSPAELPTRFTTVANWRGAFGPLAWAGAVYGLKVHEFRKLIELPRVAPGTFEVALGIDVADDADRRRLLEHGWRLVDPGLAARPDGFRRYVQGSGAEFSVAQGVYVATGCGWFSDRSVRYLASGKPVLVQETGFSAGLPAGKGLVPFTDLDSAVKGAQDIVGDYAGHCRVARALAEEHFAAEVVLPRFLEDADVGRVSRRHPGRRDGA